MELVELWRFEIHTKCVVDNMATVMAANYPFHDPSSEFVSQSNSASTNAQSAAVVAAKSSTDVAAVGATSPMHQNHTPPIAWGRFGKLPTRQRR